MKYGCDLAVVGVRVVRISIVRDLRGERPVICVQRLRVRTEGRLGQCVEERTDWIERVTDPTLVIAVD